MKGNLNHKLITKNQLDVLYVHCNLTLGEFFSTNTFLCRGDFAASKEKNLCHVSDSPDAAAAEIRLWFQPEEILTWSSVQEVWLR